MRHSNNSWKLRGAGVLASLALVMGPGTASATFFTTEASFSAANTGLALLDFEGIAPPGSFIPLGSFPFANGTITSPNNSIAISDSVLFATPSDVLFDNIFGGTIAFTFGPNVNAVGFDVGVGFSGGNGFFDVFDGLTLLDSQTVAESNQNTMSGFVGWSGLGDITSVTFRTASSAFPLIDNLRFGGAAQTIPEPTSLGLIGLTLVGMGFSRRQGRA